MTHRQTETPLTFTHPLRDAWVRAAWQLAPDAMALSDADGTVLLANPAYFALYGYTAQQVLGQSFAIIFPPEVRAWAIAQYHEVFNAPEPPPDFESVVQRADGSRRIVETRINFVNEDGQRVAMQSVIRDITRRAEAEHAARAAQAEAERAAAQMSRLQALTANLAAARTVPTVAEVILEQALPLVGASAALLFLLDEPQAAYEVVGVRGLPEAAWAPWRRFPATAPLPVVEAVRTGQAVLLPTPESARERYPALVQAGTPHQAWAVLPFVGRGGALGGLALSFEAPQGFDAAQRDLMQALTNQSAQAFERARLFAGEQESRAHLELRVHERTRELMNMNQRLSDEVAQRQATEARLRALSDRLASTREEERLRLARELHDQLGGELTGLKMDLRRVQKVAGLAETQAAPLAAAIDDMVELVRRIATELRPGILDDLGLVPALSWQLEEFEKRSGVACRLAAPDDPPPLAPEAAIAVFRVVQECLTNVARHARATTVEVSVVCGPGHLQLELRDNGRGYDAEAANGREGLGLLGIRERLRPVGGEFSIEGGAEGTTVRVAVPLGHAPATN